MTAYPKPAPRRKAAPAKPTPQVRHDVIARDKSQCQWCGRVVDTSAGWYSLQHRRARGMGGTSRPESNTAANLVLVHGTGTTGCHGDIERHPLTASAAGFRIQQHDKPYSLPVFGWAGFRRVWWVFDDDGGRNQISEETAIQLLKGGTR